MRHFLPRQKIVFKKYIIGGRTPLDTKEVDREGIIKELYNIKKNVVPFKNISDGFLAYLTEKYTKLSRKYLFKYKTNKKTSRWDYNYFIHLGYSEEGAKNKVQEIQKKNSKKSPREN